MVQVVIYKKNCSVKNCETSVSKSKLENEVKLAILKKATLFKREQSEKNSNNILLMENYNFKVIEKVANFLGKK